jgi:hypoxanthine phosphoribosyltransferase
LIKFQYIDADLLLVDSFKLGKKIFQTGFIPTHAISLWRGGSPVGLAVGEYFRLKGHFINHTTVATASYTGINSQSEVIIKGLEHLIKTISKEDKLLIIDDIYDSGTTIKAIIDTIQKTARLNSPDNILVACVYNKIYKHRFQLDSLTLNDVIEDKWVSFPHEISDLVNEDDPEELNLLNKSKSIYSILHTKEIFKNKNERSNEKYKYISANTLMEDSLKLAHNIYQSGYIPDFLIATWPGGVNAGLPIHEYFKYRIKHDKLNVKIPDHIAINTSTSHYSYKINIIGIKYLEDNINYTDKILLVDTAFSTGRLLNQTIDKLKEILRRNINVNNIKIAVVYYKPNEDATWTTIPTFTSPHFYLNKVKNDIIFPQQIHRLTNPEKELEALNPELKKVIYD